MALSPPLPNPQTLPAPHSLYLSHLPHQTIYVENLPKVWTFHDFRHVLHRYGIIGMTSIPRKHSLKGLCFGFVYLHPNWGIQVAIKTINSISCGFNRPLRTFYARYLRTSPKPKPMIQPLPSNPKPQKTFKKRDTRTYL